MKKLFHCLNGESGDNGDGKDIYVSLLMLLLFLFCFSWPSWRLDVQGYLPRDLEDRGVSKICVFRIYLLSTFHCVFNL